MMKKLKVAAVPLCGLLALAGCGRQAATQTTVAPPEPAVKAAPPTPPPTENPPTATPPPGTGPTLSQSKGDQLLHKLFFGGHQLPRVIEPNEFDLDGDADLDPDDQEKS